MNYDKDLINKLKFNEQGLIPAVLQDVNTGEILMVAYMNKESLEKTLASGKACFWSRSRQELWLKGETSGNYQYVEDILIDCDSDTLLVKVKPEGPACHTGRRSCFYRTFDREEISEENDNKTVDKTEVDKTDDEFLNKVKFLKELSELIEDRKVNLPEESYTTYLFEEGIDKIGKKIGEEAAEVIIAAKNEDKKEIIYESADLIYHLLVLLVENDVSFTEVMTELIDRHSK